MPDDCFIDSHPTYYLVSQCPSMATLVCVFGARKHCLKTGVWYPDGDRDDTLRARSIVQDFREFEVANSVGEGNIW